MARETREAWARRVERWRRSGLTARGFAVREGVNANTLAFWKWKLGPGAGEGRQGLAKRRRAGKRIAFVEVVAPKASLAPAGESRAGAIFEVVLPAGYRVRLAPGFERDALGELLDVLEARR